MLLMFNHWWNTESSVSQLVLYGIFYVYTNILTLTLPELKLISHFHQYAVWPSSILLADQLQLFILISLKMRMDCRWIIPFKKFSWLRVKVLNKDTKNECFSLSYLTMTQDMTYTNKQWCCCYGNICLQLWGILYILLSSCDTV